MKKMNFWLLPLLILVLFGTTNTAQPATAEAASQKEKATATQLSRNQTTIVLDAGHGGYDSGGEARDGTLEKDITLQVSLLVGKQLSEAGYQVIYTRISDDVSWPSDNLSDLAQRVSIAEDGNADYYISLHTNSSESYDDGAYGIEGYVASSHGTTATLCDELLSALEQLGYTQNRGLKTTAESSLYVIDHNAVPAILLELGFLSDSDDAAYMESAAGQQQIADAIAAVIIANC